MNDQQKRHVFISYVRENSEQVQRLCDELTKHGVKVWLDRNEIKPGSRWRDAIRDAINEGAFFIACFSEEYQSKAETHMNEELTLAIDRLRKIHNDREWFIPVLLSDCDVPDRNIGAGETLPDIQWVALYKDWEGGINRILNVINPRLTKVKKLSVREVVEQIFETPKRIKQKRLWKSITLGLVIFIILLFAITIILLIFFQNPELPHNWRSWKYHIFYCNESNMETINIAELIQKRLLGAGLSRSKVKIEVLPEWEKSEKSIKYIFPGYEIRAERNEVSVARHLESLLRGSIKGDQLRIREIDPEKPTLGYVSFFLCPGVSKPPGPGVPYGKILK